MMGTSRILHCCWPVALVLSASAASANDSVIQIRVSFKVVLNPVDGSRPIGPDDDGDGMWDDDTLTNADVDFMVNGINTLLAAYWRGYRVERVDPVTDVGGAGAFFGPSAFYDTDFFAEENEDAKGNMEEAALDSPGAYAWNPNAINIYITNWADDVANRGGGKCSMPADEIIVLSAASMDTPFILLHEIGHYFNLCHTQGCACGRCATDDCDSAESDGIHDTLPDRQCWDLDDIAFTNFFQPYAALPPGLQGQVDDAAQNLMSYHHLAPLNNVLSRLTEGQLDVWTIVANGGGGCGPMLRDPVAGLPFTPGLSARSCVDGRRHVVDGRTLFVDSRYAEIDIGGSPPDAQAYSIVPAAVAAANSNGNDIILLEPGSHLKFYTTIFGAFTISKPVTLRATRRGAATLGGDP